MQASPIPPGRPGPPTDGINTPLLGFGGCFLHEWAFAGVLLFLAWRFMEALGPKDPAGWIPLALLALDAGLIVLDRRLRSTGTARARLLFHTIAMNVVYFRLGMDLPRLQPVWQDPLLLGLDQDWFGETPAVRLRALAHPLVTEVLSLCYLLFYPAMAFYQWDWLKGSLPTARRFFVGLYLIYSAGFLGYALLPAKGPWIHLATTLPGLTGGPFTLLTDFVVRTGCNGVDVFPSLHAAVAAYFLGFDHLERRRRRFQATLLPVLGLCGATFYLGYHYAIDVIAGLVLTGVALIVARPGPSGPPVRIHS